MSEKPSETISSLAPEKFSTADEERSIEQSLSELELWLGIGQQEIAEINAEDLGEKVMDRMEKDVSEYQATTSTLAEEIFGQPDSKVEINLARAVRFFNRAKAAEVAEFIDKEMHLFFKAL